MSNSGRKGYMYTPFGGSQALDSAMGENMARVSKGKQAHGLIAPDHDTADQLEALKQRRLSSMGKTLTQANTILQQSPVHKAFADSQFLATIKASVEAPGATIDDTQQARALGRMVHSQQLDDIGHRDTMAKNYTDANQQKFDALKQTRIVNTSPGAYPDLHPTPLGHIKPDTQHSKGDKLYVLGHGMPGDNRLHARSDGQNGNLTGTQLAKHLEDAGLSKNVADVRLTACQGVPKITDEMQNPAQDTKNSGYVVPDFAKGMKQRGYNNLTVTGYQGNGVTFPYAGNHLRSNPTNDNDRTKRSQQAVRYPTKDL